MNFYWAEKILKVWINDLKIVPFTDFSASTTGYVVAQWYERERGQEEKELIFHN